jgi:RNA polymerase sigma-70 factor (ECF subfamily)
VVSDHLDRHLSLTRMRLTEDARLAELAASGTVSAFDELFRRHCHHVHALAYHMLRDGDAADDVVQEVFVRVHRGLRGFRGGCSVKGWIMRIAVNECVSSLRREQRRRAQHSEVRRRAVARRESAARGSPHIEAAVEALSSLKATERALIVMRDIVGYSYEEMGEALRCSSSSIGVRLHRARTKLRREFRAILAEGSRP